MFVESVHVSVECVCGHPDAFIYICVTLHVCVQVSVCVCVCVAVCVTSHSHLHIEHSVLSRLVDFSSEIAPLFIAFHAAVNT